MNSPPAPPGVEPRELGPYTFTSGSGGPRIFHRRGCEPRGTEPAQDPHRVVAWPLEPVPGDSRLGFSRGGQPPAWDVSACSLLGNVGVGRARKRNRYGALSRAGHRGRIYKTDYKRPAAVPLQARTRGVFIHQILGVMTHSHSWRLSFVAVPTCLAHRSRVSGDCGTQPLVCTVTVSTTGTSQRSQSLPRQGEDSLRALRSGRTSLRDGLGGVHLDLREGRRGGLCCALVSPTIPPFPPPAGRD